MIYIKQLRDSRKGDRFQVGGKAALLGELRTRFPVPDGFCVTVAGYRHVVEETGIQAKIHALLDSAVVSDPRSLATCSAAIGKLFLDMKLPKRLKLELARALSSHEMVAVRASPTIEASDAEGPESFAASLGLRGEKPVEKVLKECFASLYASGAILFRETNRIIHREAFMAVLIQDHVEPSFAGTVFTVDPVNRKHVLIEAVQVGSVGPRVPLPNTYFFDRKTGRPHDTSEHFLFDHALVEQLFRLSLQAESHLESALDISFTIDRQRKIWIIGCRPMERHRA